MKVNSSTILLFIVLVLLTTPLHRCGAGPSNVVSRDTIQKAGEEWAKEEGFTWEKLEVISLIRCDADSLENCEGAKAEVVGLSSGYPGGISVDPATEVDGNCFIHQGEPQIAYNKVCVGVNRFSGSAYLWKNVPVQFTK